MKLSYSEIAQPIVNHVRHCSKCLHATDDNKLCDVGNRLKNEAYDLLNVRSNGRLTRSEV